MISLKFYYTFLFTFFSFQIFFIYTDRCFIFIVILHANLSFVEASVLKSVFIHKPQHFFYWCLNHWNRNMDFWQILYLHYIHTYILWTMYIVGTALEGKSEGRRFNYHVTLALYYPKLKNLSTACIIIICIYNNM